MGAYASAVMNTELTGLILKISRTRNKVYLSVLGHAVAVKQKYTKSSSLSRFSSSQHDIRAATRSGEENTVYTGQRSVHGTCFVYAWLPISISSRF